MRPNAKLPMKKRAQSKPGKEELQAGSPQSPPSSEEARGGSAGTLWHTGHLHQVVEEGGREAVLLSLVLALLTRVWQKSAELWHPCFRSDVEMFRKQPKKS